MNSKALEILEEKVVELISRMARIQEENTRLKEQVLTLKRELETKDKALRDLAHQREAVRAKIDNLIRRIEEYQEVLSQDLDFGGKEHGQS